jgi:hypothetical protein
LRESSISAEEVEEKHVSPRRSPGIRKITDLNRVAVEVLFKLYQNEVWKEVDKSDVNWLEITNDIIRGVGLEINDVKGLLFQF